MKHLKYFENTTEDELIKPQIGDYVICKERNNNEDERLRIFISNNIGKIYFIENINVTETKYFIIFENIPKDIENNFHFNDMTNCRFMYLNEIIHSSPNKKKLEPILQSNKFNL